MIFGSAPPSPPAHGPCGPLGRHPPRVADTGPCPPAEAVKRKVLRRGQGAPRGWLPPARRGGPPGPLNGCFPGGAVRALRDLGHDVAGVRTDAPGSSDRELLARAMAEGRTVLTFDKGFGALAFRAGLPASCRVILFRVPPTSPGLVIRAAGAALGSRADWVGHFAVVQEHRVRMTRLPSAATGGQRS